MIINYGILAEAQQFYTEMGFQFIETPWLVSPETSSITAPPDVLRYVVTKGDKKKEFVASGEQGFLYLALKGYIRPGKYATITPCLRNDNFDFTHSKQFMKCELINLLDYVPAYPLKEVREMAEIALDFFDSYNIKCSIQNISADQIDIEDENGIELGSYGYRKHQGLYWIYGTGVAEPRFSRVEKLQNE